MDVVLVWVVTTCAVVHDVRHIEVFGCGKVPRDADKGEALAPPLAANGRGLVLAGEALLKEYLGGEMAAAVDGRAGVVSLRRGALGRDHN